MTKRGVKKTKVISGDSNLKQSPADLWGASRWRTIKFVSGFISFAILAITLSILMRLGDAITMADVLPGFLIDAVLFVVGIFLLLSPYSPLRLYGKPKHRWLFGWVFFMGLISHFIANLIGLLRVGGIL